MHVPQNLKFPCVFFLRASFGSIVGSQRNGDNSYSTLIDPDSVEVVETTITQALDTPVELIVRSILAADVGALGSNLKVTQKTSMVVFQRERGP